MTRPAAPWPRPLLDPTPAPTSAPTLATGAAPVRAAPSTREQRRVILASSLGTVFEWYDFYLYGAMAALIARHFFGALDPSSAFFFALLAFAAGFVVRPFGALVFGRLGDLVGRKYTFLVTIVVMGLATFSVGLLPGYHDIGLAAPVILVGLRLLQGLALGGEYGGAVVYVAEHAPVRRRGLYTGWIQTTATLGLLLALLVILGTRALVGDAAFEAWGWRVPFLLSFGLLLVSGWVRLRMAESPLFQALRDRGGASSGPVRESLGRWRNLRLVLLALFGLVAGQAVVWYAGQLYVLLFLKDVLKVESGTASLLMAVALLVAAPFFVVFGALSDRIGRKPVLGAGLLLAVLGLMPLFKALTLTANPALAHAQATVIVTVRADPASCSLQGNPVARDIDLASGCDLARRALAEMAVHHAREALPPGSAAEVVVDGRRLQLPELVRVPGTQRLDNDSVRSLRLFRKQLTEALAVAGYPLQAPAIAAGSAPWWRLVGLLSLLGIVVAMVYGPTAATLAELFPTRIRYTSVSLPYHLGNGWFGGMLPSIAFAMAAAGGNVFHGLWYPVGVAALTFVVAALWLPETRGRDLGTMR